MRPPATGPGWGGPARGWGRPIRPQNQSIVWHRWCSPESRAERLRRLEEMLAVLEHYAQHGQTEQLRVMAAERAAQRLMDADRHALLLDRMLSAGQDEDAPRVVVTLRDSDD